MFAHGLLLIDNRRTGLRATLSQTVLILDLLFWQVVIKDITEGFGRPGIPNEVLWNSAEIKPLQILPSHKCYFVLLRDSNVAKTFAVPRSGPIFALKKQGLSETMNWMRIKPKSYYVRILKLFRCGLQSWAEALRCQPIRYILSGFVSRTGLFGPIGRST